MRSPPPPASEDTTDLPPLLPTSWTKQLIPDIAGSTTLTAMFWNCQGRLHSPGNIMTSGIRAFLTEVVALINEHDTDVMFLTDCHNTKGSLTQYLPLMRERLPDSRIYQFPTTAVRGGSSTYDRMGGAIAIISYKWRGFTANTSTDPMGIGILNMLDLVRGPYKFRILNIYLPPFPGGDGPGSIVSRVRQFLDRSSLPTHTKRLPPLDFILEMAQQWITAGRSRQFTILVGGDFNIPLSGRPTTSAKLSTWMHNNHLCAPFRHTLHEQADYHTWFGRLTLSTTIDHILHTPLPSSVIPSVHGTVSTTTINAFSDHHPIWIRLCLTDPLLPVPKRRSTPPLSRIDIDTQDKAETLRYQDLLTAAIRTLPREFRSLRDDGRTAATPAQSSACVAAIQRLSYNMVASPAGLNKKQKQRIKKRCLRQRSCFKDGFSPEMRLLQIYRDFYQQLIRRAFPHHSNRRVRQWNGQQYQQVLTSWIAEWSRVNETQLQRIPPSSRIHRIPPPTHLQYLPFHSITLASLQDIVTRIKGWSHGAMRIIMRGEMSAAIKHRDRLRQEHKIGAMIEAMSGEPRDQLDLHTLPCHIRGQLVDHREIHEALTAYFKEWHSTPLDLDPAARNMDTPHFWRTLLHPSSHIIAPPDLHPDSCIPKILQRGLRQACARKVSDAFCTRMSAAIHAPVTFAEFQEAIKNIPNGGAPGPSLATANMVKAWPDSVQILVFQHMTNIWSSLSSPSWFKDKVMKLAPKMANNPELANIRPISLYEIIRKVWTTILAKRINKEWHDGGVLQRDQYGYRLDNGTPMPLLNIHDEIEDAIHNKKIKLLTCWDV